MGDLEDAASASISRRDALLGAGLAAVGAIAAACSSSSGTSATVGATEPPATTAPPTTGGTTAPPAAYVPAAGAAGAWATADAAATGWSAPAIGELADFVGSHNSTTLIVLAGGRILAEQYWNGGSPTSTQDIASCQKSIVSTLVGCAVDRQLLSIDDPASKYLPPGWTNATSAEEASITIRQLLSMTSGLDQQTLKLIAPPGTKWQYNTTAYQKLRTVIEKAASGEIQPITREWLFDPIGVSDLSVWVPREGNGPYAVDATGARLWALAMTARDMARVGLLVQRKGRWGDRVVVPEAWFAQALVPSQRMNEHYGFLWWLVNDQAPIPADTVAALGALDQKIYVCPSLDVVVTRQGAAAGQATEAGSGFDREVLSRLVAARR
jgi:CubicO group peptidase (beta-lactamase class C family)